MLLKIYAKSYIVKHLFPVLVLKGIIFLPIFSVFIPETSLL